MTTENEDLSAAAAETDKFKGMIAVMKELESWGADEEGNKFSFGIKHHSLLNKFYLVGKYAKETGGNEKGIDYIVAGLDGENGGEFGVCNAHMPTHIDENPINYAILNSYMRQDVTSENANLSVTSFAKRTMKEHPRFKQAVQQSAQQVIDSVKAKPLSFN